MLAIFSDFSDILRFFYRISLSIVWIMHEVGLCIMCVTDRMSVNFYIGTQGASDTNMTRWAEGSERQKISRVGRAGGVRLS